MVLSAPCRNRRTAVGSQPPKQKLVRLLSQKQVGYSGVHLQFQLLWKVEAEGSMFEASSGQTQSEKQSKKNFFVFLKI
jgi:hypothetical protein